MKMTLVEVEPGEAGAAPVRRETQYELPDDMGLISISAALQHIARHHGAGGYYLSCRRGMCAACVVRVGGKVEMACVTPAFDGMVVEPLRADLLVAGTVVDLSMAREAQFEYANAFATEGAPT